MSCKILEDRVRHAELSDSQYALTERKLGLLLVFHPKPEEADSAKPVADRVQERVTEGASSSGGLKPSEGALSSGGSSGVKAAEAPPPIKPPVPPPPAPHPQAPIRETEEQRLRREAVSVEHMRSHFPKNHFCKICYITKNTSMSIARKPGNRSDRQLPDVKKKLQQLETEDVVLCKGDSHRGKGHGGITRHHVVRDSFTGARFS